MRILIIAPEQIPVPPPVGGSVENCIFQISRKISSEHQVTIVSRHRGNLPGKSVSGNVTIIRVTGGRHGSYLTNVISKIRGNRFDMIQIDNRPRFVPAVRRAFPNTPISVFLHSTTFISPPMTSISLTASQLEKANLIVGNSRSLQDKLRTLFPKQKQKVRFVHLGVDLMQFHPKPGTKRDGRSFTILFAGRLIPRKGIPVLMRAVKIVRKTIPNARLLIAGGTGKAVYKQSLNRLAARLQIPVIFKGYVPRRRMPQFYWSGDCFVCPSQGHEAFGLVNVEAMASGTPCVASRNGGIPEIIKHNRNGLLVNNYKRPDAFAKQILNLSQNTGLAKRLSEQARNDVVAAFSWRATATKLERIYKNYLSGK